MRLLKLKLPILALVFAVIAFVLSFGFCFAVSLVWPSAPTSFLDLFYSPAAMLALLCMPSSFDFNGSGALLFALCAYFFAFVQLYLIILVGIGVHRHFRKKAS